MKFAHRPQPIIVKYALVFMIGCSALTLSTQFAQAQESAVTSSSSATVTQPTDPAPAVTEAAGTAAATSIWSVGPIDFSGLVDGYYNYNANHPIASSYGNQLHDFDFDANAFSVNMAKLTMSHDADPVGFRVDIGFGKAFTYILASEPNFTHLEQAYVSVKPTNAKGFEADFGEFVTSAGAEVIETKDNWNYSRSILFSYALPFYHVGLRTSMPLTKSLTAGVQVVNGWNNFSDNNSGKTVGITGAYTTTKFTWFGNFYTGPENTGTNKGFRNLLDTTLLLTPTSKFNAYLNYDYVQNRNAIQTGATSYEAGTLDRFQGFAGDLRYQLTSTLAVAARGEYVSDDTSGSGIGMGTNQKYNEFTITGEYKIPQGMLIRVEYRRDGSDQPYFNKGTASLVKGQSTVDVGVVAFFGPKR